MVLVDEQRVPRNSDVSVMESLSNGSDWNNRSAVLTANGNNASDSLSQDDDLGRYFGEITAFRSENLFLNYCLV